MYFSDEALKSLRAQYSTVSGKCDALFLGYISREYKNGRAREYATQGFLRRVKILVRCMEKVFEILPPDRTELPSRDELSDAAINIQAFVFNVFGSADNLAWVWVREKNLTKKDGLPIPPGWVGLGKKNELVRSSFSAEMLKYLKGLNDWFVHLENYRHALAHRIPLYIPPYIISKDTEEAYVRLENEMAEAFKRRDFTEHDRLSAEQEALGVYRPWITHSVVESAGRVLFHPQMLADFNTIVELGQKMLEELDR